MSWYILAFLLGLVISAQSQTQDSNDFPSSMKEDVESGKEDELDKRAWKDLSYGWGKRGWQDLQSSGWGKRAWRDMQGAWGKRGWSDLQSSGWGKRGWKDLQSTGWGKRSSWQDRASTDGKTSDNLAPEPSFKDDATKRTWNSLHGAWGKRAADWSSFRGSWGKRDPAWQNLKGLWGKRNYGGFMESFDPGFNNMDDETRRDK